MEAAANGTSNPRDQATERVYEAAAIMSLLDRDLESDAHLISLGYVNMAARVAQRLLMQAVDAIEEIEEGGLVVPLLHAVPRGKAGSSD